MASPAVPQSDATSARPLAARVFNESAMGFLALVAFAVALGPLVFDLSPAADRALQGVEWTLVAILALDLAVQAALAERHINVKSFEMNKFLKLLAIVSFLGLIPSVVGGMLGVNVAGNPWNVTLGQVAFGVGMTAGTAHYVFAVKGWLR